MQPIADMDSTCPGITQYNRLGIDKSKYKAKIAKIEGVWELVIIKIRSNEWVYQTPFSWDGEKWVLPNPIKQDVKNLFGPEPGARRGNINFSRIRNLAPEF